jgi:hypothetical protein
MSDVRPGMLAQLLAILDQLRSLLVPADDDPPTIDTLESRPTRCKSPKISNNRDVKITGRSLELQ